MQRITSRQNPRLREVARLLGSARDRRRANQCVLEGEHVVAVYAARHGAPAALVVADDALARPGVAALAARYDARTVLVPERLFGELAVLPAGVGMLALVDVPPAGAVPPGDFCLLIDGVQDPGNVGSMLRSAAAAGVTDVLLSPPSAFAWSPKVLRAGQGAHFRLRLHEDVDLPAWASAYRAAGGHVVATVVAQAGAIFATALTGRLALAIGNEGAGLSAALLAAADRRATIPMPGGFESLNAAAAAAVVLFEAVRQRGAPGAAAR